MPTEHDDLMQNFGQNNLDSGVTPLPKNNMFETPKSSVLSRRVLHDDWKDLSLDELQTRFEVADPHEYDSQPDKIGMVFFQGNWDTQTIAGILSLIDATILIPTNCSVRDTAATKHPVFLAKLINISNLMNNWKTNEKIKQSPIADKLLAAFESNDSGIGAAPLNDKRQADTLMVTDIVRKNQKQALSFLQSGRDKINFLYSLCSNYICNIKIDHDVMKYEEILGNFILLQINRLENAKTEQEQNDLFSQIMANIMLEESDLKCKIDQFKNSLGQIKFSKPLSMPVVLDNGTRTDLFKLDNSQIYRIMHSVNVSKINESMDFSNIIVNGDFICARAKKSIVLPKQINGLLDCSYWDEKISASNIRIPNGATAVNFTGVVKSFKDLSKINFPDSVHEVLLLNSTLKQVSKNTEELHAFEAFTAQHPQIQIWDSKHNTWLQDTLVPVQTEQKSKPMVRLVTVVPQAKPALEDKNPDWLTRKEIIAVFANEFADADVERLVKLATKTSYQNIKTENKLVDGTSVLCVHKSCLEEVKRNMMEVMNVDSKQASQPKQIVNMTAPEQQQKKIKKQKPVRFRKYIPKQVWKEICTSCNDSNGLLYSILQRINLINLDYTKQVLSGAIQYIDENGQIQVVPTLQKKRGCALAQNIEDRTKGAVSRRIVWTMNPKDKIIVAIKFCADHTDNTNAIQTYKNARTHAAKCNNMNGESVTRELINQNIDNYYDVVDLLQQYKPKEKPAVNAQTKTEKPKTQSNVRVPDKSANSALNTKKAPKASLVDMTSLEYKIRAMIKTLAGDIEKKNYRFTKLKNTDAKLKVWEEIKVCLDRQKRLEQELQEMIK
ncbi:MAG: hypothetical protein IKP24_01355 [Alphaproteobacteria bacterium]|nr:hypothetical protein [Alphaproteobacteria bacterium]